MPPSARSPLRFAGLAALQDDEASLLLSIARRVVEVGRRFDGEAPMLASAPIPDAGPVRLRIEADGAGYAFADATAGDDGQTLARGLGGPILSTLLAPGSVGAAVGMDAPLVYP